MQCLASSFMNFKSITNLVRCKTFSRNKKQINVKFTIACAAFFITYKSLTIVIYSIQVVIKILSIISFVQMIDTNYLNQPSSEYLRFDKSGKIPPIIHHISPSKEIPMQWLDSHVSCTYNQVHRENYEMYMWTDETIRKFIADHYAWFLPTFDSYRYQIQRVDAVRYFILHFYGGIYLDLDVGCRTSVEIFRHQNVSVLVPMTRPLGVSNDLMMSSPDSPFMSFLIKRLSSQNQNWWFHYPTVVFSTGPLFLSLALYDYCSYKHASRLRGSIAADTGISTSRECDVGLIDEVSYTKLNFFHVEGSSWHSWDAKFVLFCYHQKWMIAILFFLSARYVRPSNGRLISCVRSP